MFDPATNFPKSYVSSSDNLGRRSSDSYDHAMNYDSRVQKTAQNYANFRSWNNSTVEEDESGVSTPPLWRSSTPTRSPPHRQNIDYRCLSPNSKAQAIARGQQELMEMVSKMPESCYELTLKDLVEHQDQQAAVVEPKQDSLGESKETTTKKKKKKSNQKPEIKRSGSIDNGGFLLKMVLPISLGSKKKKNKKKIDSSTNHNSKVSPKPMVSSDASGNNKAVDKDWWKKRSGSSESESGGSTLNSGSTKSSRSSSRSSSCRSTSSNSSRRHRRSGCLDFILHRKGKASR